MSAIRADVATDDNGATVVRVVKAYTNMEAVTVLTVDEAEHLLLDLHACLYRIESEA